MPYAVVLAEHRDDPTSVLMLLDDRWDAERVAVELRMFGRPADVRRAGGLSEWWKSMPSLADP